MVDEELLKYYYNVIKSMDYLFLSNLYSPMYDKYFDKISDDEIKKQIAVWLMED